MLATYDTSEPSMLVPRYYAPNVWRAALQHLRGNGHMAKVEGYDVREVAQYSLQMNTNYPTVDAVSRKTLYAQAYRLLSFAASNDVVTNAKYAQDVFHNAPVLVQRLRRDPDAGSMTLRDWLPYPTYAGPTFPVSVHAYVRRARLQVCVYTAMSHAWSGLPCDLFAFAMLAQYLALGIGVSAGMLYYTTGRLYLPTRLDYASQTTCAVEADGIPVGPWRDTAELAEHLRVNGGF